MALEAGLIGVAATNTSPLVAPTRSKDGIFGTNPLSVRFLFAFPIILLFRENVSFIVMLIYEAL